MYSWVCQIEIPLDIPLLPDLPSPRGGQPYVLGSVSMSKVRQNLDLIRMALGADKSERAASPTLAAG